MSTTITNVQESFLALLTEVLDWLPRLLTAAVLLLVGYLLARVVREVLLRVLRAVHFDRVADRAGVSRGLRLAGMSLDAAGALALVVFWWIALMFVEMAINALGLVQISTFLNGLIAYVPNILAAMLILVLGALIAHVLADVVRGAASEAGLSRAGMLADVARWAILTFAFLAALTQLNVARSMIVILFAGIVAMLAIAGGLAFGLGGVDTARGLISGWAMGRALQPGQRIQIGDQSGIIVRHDMHTTVIDTGTGQVAIPNGELSHERVVILSQDGLRRPTAASGLR